MNVRNGGSFGKVATMPADLDVSPRTLPTATRASDPGGRRFRADATVLADGTVFLSGGARASQKLDKAVHFGEIRDPETDTWTQMRESIDRKARLYHSTAILLPDASVLLSADGPPGPVVIHTADIFYPPYLFNADGTDATRPEILDIGELNYQSRFTMSPGNSAAISKVALVRAGSVTHSFDMGQRYMELGFNQDGAVLDVEAPRRRNSAPPGLYMVFVFDQNGVPSIAATSMLN